jgi:hypothetical protein
LTPAKLEKIRALANDVRGDAATRAIALAALKRYAAPEPAVHDIPPLRNQPHPGMRRSPDYEKYVFMDLGQWKTSANGNLTYVITRGGRTYRIVLFKHKKTPTWGWLKIHIDTDQTEFSGRFQTMGAAHRDAWEHL